MHAILEEVAVDWPLLLYLALTSCFSICFLRDLRTESRALKQMNEQLEDRLTNRFRRLEYLLEKANTVSLTNGDPYHQSQTSELSADGPTRGFIEDKNRTPERNLRATIPPPANVQ